MQTVEKTDLDEVFANGKAVEAVLQQAVREAVLRHKRLGESIAGMRDGKVIIVPPEEIPEHE